MGALRKAQYLYDNAEPAPDDGQAEAERIWIDDMAEQLLAGAAATFKIGDMVFGVTFERFAQAIDEHAMCELGRKDCSQTVLGRLMLAALSKLPSDAKAAAVEIMAVPDPQQLLVQLARDLLTPFALPGTQAAAAEAREP
ncbi:hypothetical protein [Pseudomonas putida]|uniref:hypothetical protein n=1 Tax=Pseudomonas putida TaxID=303 RepID=UPI0018D8BA01|nr:hypothetical protein [Pseudomonas putida]MBH3412554.1 hypothetical protein [Pseudomonas putida]